MPVRFVIIGGGPAGIQAATHAARLGAEVTLVERDVMGGSANLWDCIPSKAMIATGGVIGVTRRGHALGLTCTSATLDLPALAERIGVISSYLERSVTELLTSQEVRVVRGRATLKGPHDVVVETSEGRILELDAEVAAALEADFLSTGVVLYKGARATGVNVKDDGLVVECNDGRMVHGSHALLAIGPVPNSEGLGLEAAGVDVDDAGYVPVNQHCQSNVSHIYAAGDLSGKLPLASVASTQGRKVAEHVMGLHTRQHRHLDYD